jgi:anti-sigma-K factor RskA
LDIKSYISSGILELYVLGQLTPEEMREVEIMQEKHIEIKREIYEISLGLEKYGQLSGIKAPESVGTKLFDNLPKRTPTVQSASKDNMGSNHGLQWNLLTSLFALIGILGFTLYYLQLSENKATSQQYESQLRICDSITNQQEQQFALLNQINDPNNKIIDMTPTAGYARISVYLHHNTVSKKNFLQLVNLPEITSDQAFQLWSLKDGADPMPLNVFADKNTIIPVDFIDKTATYAITIEPKGGSKSPTLENLIGTMGVM